MAWFDDKLKEPVAELDSMAQYWTYCVKPEEGGIVDALTGLGNGYAYISNLGNEVYGQLATIATTS